MRGSCIPLFTLALTVVASPLACTAGTLAPDAETPREQPVASASSTASTEPPRRVEEPEPLPITAEDVDAEAPPADDTPPAQPDEWDELEATPGRTRECARIHGPMKGYVLCQTGHEVGDERGQFTLSKAGKVVRTIEYDRVDAEGAAGSLYELFSLDGTPLLVLHRCREVFPPTKDDAGYGPCGVRFPPAEDRAGTERVGQ